MCEESSAALSSVDEDDFFGLFSFLDEDDFDFDDLDDIFDDDEDFVDFLLLADNYTGEASTQSVPEPSGMLYGGAFLALVFRGRMRKVHHA